MEVTGKVQLEGSSCEKKGVGFVEALGLERIGERNMGGSGSVNKGFQSSPESLAPASLGSLHSQGLFPESQAWQAAGPCLSPAPVPVSSRGERDLS